MTTKNLHTLSPRAEDHADNGISMVATLSPSQVLEMIEPPVRVDARCTIPGSETLTVDQDWILTHWTMYGSDGYPVQKLGSGWQVLGQRGYGAIPTVFKTKRDAVAAWERFLWLLVDYKKGDVPNPYLR